MDKEKRERDLRNGEAIIGNECVVVAGGGGGWRISGSGRSESDTQLRTEAMLRVGGTGYGLEWKRNGSRPSWVVGELGASWMWRKKKKTEKPVTGADGGSTWHSFAAEIAFLVFVSSCLQSHISIEQDELESVVVSPQPPNFGLRVLFLYLSDDNLFFFFGLEFGFTSFRSFAYLFL